MLSLDATVDFFDGLMASAKPSGFWLTFERLLRALDRREVHPVFAGALALQAHGVIRATPDIEILVRPEERQTALAALRRIFAETQDFDTLVVYQDRQTGVEVDVLVPYDAISLAACSSPERAKVRGRTVDVVRLPDLVAMKVVAAVDSPAIEPKQRLDVDSLLRHAQVPVNKVSETLLEEAGREYARYFMDIVRHVRAHPAATPPRQRLPPKSKK